MNRKKLRMAFVLIALVLTGAVFTSAFLSIMNGNQVQESILFKVLQHPLISHFFL